MSAPVPTLRIDTSGTAFGTAPTYTDRTSYLMTGSQYPVDITFGRQDEQSEPQPSTCTFFLSNADGFWTPGSGVGPVLWDIGCPVNVRLTANAVTYDRFTGFVDAIEPTWPGGVQSWSVVKVSCTDVSARLGIAKPLKALPVQEMIYSGATHLYLLNEPEGSTACVDSIGGGPIGQIVPDTVAGGGSTTFGVDLGLAYANSTGITFDAPLPGDSIPASPLVIGNGAFVQSAGAFSIALWVKGVTSVGAVGKLFFKQRGSSSLTDIRLRLVPGPPAFQFIVYDTTVGETRATGSASTITDGGLHHVVCTFASDRKTQRIYIDGALSGTNASATARTLSGLDTHYVGGDGGAVAGAGLEPIRGTMARYGVWNTELSAAQVLDLYEMDLGTFAERTDERFARVAAYGAVTTSGLPTGVATAGSQNTAGVTAVAALSTVARTEGTFAYVTTAGALTFQSRTHRYHRAVELALAASDIATPGVRRDRQGVANELTVTREGGAAQVVIDAASQTAIGRFDGGSFEVCPSTDEDGWQNATWQVQNRKTTRTRMPDVTVDLYRQTSTTVVAQCLGATIGSKAQVTSLPANAPASSMTLFVEGYTETIGYDRWSMGFYTSPIGLEDSVLVLDNATTGALDTYRLAF